MSTNLRELLDSEFNDYGIEWEIESILYIYNNEKESNIRGRSQQSLDFSRWDAEYKHTHARTARGDNDESI